MFGTNPLRKQTKDAGGVLWVQKVFGTIQGEGPLAGSPAIFVRLAGCNLKCHFCDTDFESSTWNPTVDALLKAIDEARSTVQTDLIVLTGGEPLRQNIVPLLSVLLGSGLRVQIETAGTLWVDGLALLCENFRESLTFVCSPKTGLVNDFIAKYCRHWKYITAVGQDGRDGLPVTSTQVKNQSPRALYRPRVDAIERGDTIWLQPQEEYSTVAGCTLPDAEGTRANMQLAAMLCMTHGYRLSLQTHKIVGVE